MRLLLLFAILIIYSCSGSEVKLYEDDPNNYESFLPENNQPEPIFEDEAEVNQWVDSFIQWEKDNGLWEGN